MKYRLLKKISRYQSELWIPSTREDPVVIPNIGVVCIERLVQEWYHVSDYLNIDTINRDGIYISWDGTLYHMRHRLYEDNKVCLVKKWWDASVYTPEEVVDLQLKVFDLACDLDENYFVKKKNPKYSVWQCIVLVKDQCTNYIKIVSICHTKLWYVYSDILSCKFCESDNVRIATDYEIGAFF